MSFQSRRRANRELEEELRFHLEAEIDERVREGMSRPEAEAEVRRMFGNVCQVQEVTRQMWGWNFVQRIGQDARYAVRTLAHSPVFAITAVLSLALGIGANIAAFSLADAFLFRPLPIPRPGEVVAINGQTREQALDNVSYPDLRDLRARSRSFTGIAGYRLARLAFARTRDTVPQMKFGMEVSQGFFTILGLRTGLGRMFADDEGIVPGRDPVAILGYDFWREQFGADPAAVGSTIRLNGTPFQIVGVAPSDFTGMDPVIRPAVFIPLSMASSLDPSAVSLFDDRDNRSLNLRARLRPDVSIRRAQAELSALSDSFAREFPASDRGRTLKARTELELRIRQAPPLAALVLMVSVLSVVVLMIACANVAGLLLARSRARSREVAIRVAIGAGRARLVQQFLTESLVLAICGGAAGLGLAYGSIRYLASIRLPTDTPMVFATQLDSRVLLFALIASAASALLFGLAPALRGVRPDIAGDLKTAGLPGGGRGRTLGRGMLVSSQVALSLVLLVASATLFGGFRKMLIADPGIRTDHIMMFEFDPSMIGYNIDQSKTFFRQLMDRTGGVPGVRSATLSRAIPFRPNFTDKAVVPEGFDFPRGEISATVATNIVDEHYFATMKAPLLEGRGFSASDTADSRRVAVVNQEFGARYWKGRDAIGRRFRLGPGGPWVEVVGVARTGRYLSLAETPQPYIYLPFAQNPSSRMTMLVETEGPPAAIADPVLRAVHALDANQPVYNVRPFETYYDEGVLGPALVVIQMVGVTGMIGLSLALVGLYGLVAYSVARRTREFGIRIAVGAGRRSILGLVLRQGLILSLAGAAVGLALSVPVFRVLASALAGLGGAPALLLVLVPCGLVAITLIACWLPAWRASRIDPTRALRHE